MKISLSGLRDVAGSTVVNPVHLTINANTPTVVLQENFDRIAFVICATALAQFTIGIGDTPTLTQGVVIPASAGPFSLDHAHFGPMVGRAISVIHSSGVSTTFSAYELILIK